MRGDPHLLCAVDGHPGAVGSGASIVGIVSGTDVEDLPRLVVPALDVQHDDGRLTLDLRDGHTTQRQQRDTQSTTSPS